MINRIWEHLVRLTERENMTIIITTHYIEEARRATTVGFMRKGHLLVQDSPDTILKSFGIGSLELAFLHICSRDMDDLERERKRSALSMNRSPSGTDVLLPVSTGDNPHGRESVTDNQTNHKTDSLVVTVDSTSQQNLNTAHSQTESSDQKFVGTSAKSGSSPHPVPANASSIKNQSLISQQHKYKQSFRTQANIVRTLVMKGVIKMKRSIPYVLLPSSISGGCNDFLTFN